MWWFLLGCWVGAFVGFFTAALCFAARVQGDREREAYGLSEAAPGAVSEGVGGAGATRNLHDLKKDGGIPWPN